MNTIALSLYHVMYYDSIQEKKNETKKQTNKKKKQEQ